MARLWQCGFELNILTANFEFTNSTGAPELTDQVFRTGTRGLRISSLGSGAPKGIRHSFRGTAEDGVFYCRAYLRVATLPSTEVAIIELNDTGAFSTPIVWITLNSTGALALRDEDGQIGSDSSPISTLTWYRIEIEFNNAGAGAGVARARIDGVEFAGASNRDFSAGVLSFNVGGNLLSEANTSGDWIFDDLAINDGTGSFQNSYPGDGRIIHLHPDGAGDNTTWSRGGTDTGANWSQVSEVTPDDISTYLISNTLNQIDDFTLGTEEQIGSSDTINVVQVNVRGRVDDTTGADPNFVLRIKSSPGGTVEETGNMSLTNTTFLTNINGTPINARLTLYDLPGASTTPWTKADLDTAQVGIRESVTDTHNVNVSTLWVSVDFTVVEAAQATRKFQRNSVLGV